MGDWLELRTYNNQHYVYLPETSGAVKLRVKAAHDVNIALTNGPFEYNPITEICIDTVSAIRRNQTMPDKISVSTPGFLNENEFVSFWIRWHGNEVSVGQKGRPAFMKYFERNLHPITYFAVRAIGHWEIEVPPVLFRTLPVKPIKTGQLRWVTKTLDDQLPLDALIAGYENGEALYIGRALQRAGLLIPGKYAPSQKCTVVGWCRILRKFHTCEILCGYNAAWLETSGGLIPPHAFDAGYERGETYLIGRARIDNNLVPGKVLSSHNLCYLPYADTEIDMSAYEILVIPDKLPRAVIWRSKEHHRQEFDREHDDEASTDSEDE